MNEIWLESLHFRADVTLVAGFVLALGVTVHILLRKREVASAVGWIGLVWFAPIFGAIIYATVRRQPGQAARPAAATAGRRSQRRSVAHGPSARGGDLASLARGIGQITGRPLLAGNEVGDLSERR